MGLCEAVTSMPPSTPRWKVAKYTSSVPTMPSSSTSTPSSPRPFAQVQHIHPLIAQTVGQGRLQGRRAFTDVPAQNHFFGLQPLGKTPGDAVGDAFVQLRAQLAADVIRLEAGDSRHKRSLF